MPSALIDRYEEQVYAALLGKVIGVYLGRPFEGWPKEKIEARWGVVDRYVHEDCGVDLVVSDDDITGTLIFPRALEDSGRHAETPPAFYGENWLNYLLEGQTILWWGGLGVSTEHTAFLRLKRGIPAPESGSIALNGRQVAEQIGAQIFIEGFGLVAPGRPELAARLAEHAARVSHDGEAVHAAKVVAAMIAAAFVEKDLDALLDQGIAFAPADSLIAHVHRDVRAWAREHADWRDTMARIEERYGPRLYDGGCHVIPNHAVMVMAWAHSRGNFHEAMKIVNTAGWDTDCNAANVGSVVALANGLDCLTRDHDFRAPFADRVKVPSADPTDSADDVLRQALRIARMGRKVMGWPDLPPPKAGSWHHFSLPGALHGYLPDQDGFAARGNAEGENVVCGNGGGRGLAFRFHAGPGRVARMFTPTCLEPGGAGYSAVGTPQLYSGMTVRVEGHAREINRSARLRLVVAVREPGAEADTLRHSEPVALVPGQPFALTWRLDVANDAPILRFGFAAEADADCRGTVVVEKVARGGTAEVGFRQSDPRAVRRVPGWMSNADSGRCAFADDPADTTYFGKNDGIGLFLTGHRGWTDVELACEFRIHSARQAGVFLRYQGMRRYYAAVFTRSSARIVHRHYGEETVLAEAPFDGGEDRLFPIRAAARGGRLSLEADGRMLVEAADGDFDGGACGFYVEEGLAGFRALALRAETRPEGL